MILLFFVTCPLIWKKIIKCFLKCKEYGNSLNFKKSAFMVCFGTILGFIVSKDGNVPDPKMIEA
jgi:hypothetical protein